MRIPLDLSLPRLLARHGYRVTTTSVTRRTTRLFDTGDRRLASGGAELSLAVRDGWLWRRDPLGHRKLSVREWTAPAATPPSQLREWTRAYRRGRPLGVRATITVQRRRHRVGDPQTDALVTVLEERLDEQVGTHPTPRLRRVSVVDIDDPVAAAPLIALLRDAAIDDGPTLGLLKATTKRSPSLRAPGGTGARDLFRASATTSLIQWLYFDCELAGGSPDALRKVRVALRRLRSDLQTFATLFDRPWSDGLRAQLGDLAARLGVVRDAEVLVDRLATLVSRLPADERTSATPLLDTARGQLDAARQLLFVSLQRADYIAVLDATVSGVTSPRWAGDDNDADVKSLARRPWRRLRTYVAALDNDADDGHLHRLRILAKRARYAADACVPVAGDAAAQCAARLADLQTILGNHHDAAVTREWLRSNGRSGTDVSFVAGELAALELMRLREARDAWREGWSAASRKQDWRWLHS